MQYCYKHIKHLLRRTTSQFCRGSEDEEEEAEEEEAEEEAEEEEEEMMNKNRRRCNLSFLDGGVAGI